MKKRVMVYSMHIFSIFEYIDTEGEKIIDLYSFLLLFRYIESFIIFLLLINHLIFIKILINLRL